MQAQITCFFLYSFLLQQGQKGHLGPSIFSFPKFYCILILVKLEFIIDSSMTVQVLHLSHKINFLLMLYVFLGLVKCSVVKFISFLQYFMHFSLTLTGSAVPKCKILSVPRPQIQMFSQLCPSAFQFLSHVKHAFYLVLLFQAFSTEKQDTKALCYVLEQALQEFLKSRDLCIMSLSLLCIFDFFMRYIAIHGDLLPDCYF